MAQVMRKFLLLAICAPAFAGPAAAQGEDSTVAERDILILSTLLPGRYDNRNQVYFDGRTKVPIAQRTGRLYAEIEALESSSLGAFTVLATQRRGEDAVEARYVYAFSVDNAAGAVRMRTYRLPVASRDPDSGTYVAGCDLLWRQEVGQFHGALDAAQAQGADCALGAGGGLSPYDMMLSQEGLWVRQVMGDEATGGHQRMDRARSFACYIDVPGVGGGRDEPYERYHIPDIHDMGQQVWVDAKDGLSVGVLLQVVRWPINNQDGIFTRPSLVMYVTRREEAKKDVTNYAWTAPDAQRIGINLKWALVNCFMQSNEDVEPFFRREPRL